MELSSLLIPLAVTCLLGLVIYKLLFESSPIVYKTKHREAAGDEVAEYPKADANGPLKKHWVTNPDEEITISYAKRGPGSWRAETIFDVYERGVSYNPNAIEFQKEYKNPVTQEYEWKRWTRQQHFSDVKQAARALIKLGLEPWHSVVCIGFNSPEWLITNLGTIYAGGVCFFVFLFSIFFFFECVFVFVSIFCFVFACVI